MTDALTPTPHPDLVTVTGVRVLGRYVLELTFDTGEVKILDMEPLMWGPVFEPLLADYALFRQVVVDPEAGTITWPNGADWDPDELYTRAKAAVPVEPPARSAAQGTRRATDHALGGPDRPR